MTIRTTLMTTAIAASAVLAAPAFAGDGHKATMKSDVKIEMTDPAAKAPLQQQKAEDLYERAQQQYDAGMTEAARTSAIRGVVMEIKAENNVQKAEMIRGEDYVLQTKGETGADIQGEDFTALVDQNPTRTITLIPGAVMPSKPMNCPAGTRLEDDGTCLITGDYVL